MLVHFRIYPSDDNGGQPGGAGPVDGFSRDAPGGAPSAYVLGDMRGQTQNATSPLYAGNVTVRVDATWGLSGIGGGPRTLANPFLPYAVRENGSLPYYGFPSRSVGAAGSTDADRGAAGAPYERCKATQRCARAHEHYDQSVGRATFSAHAFAGGRHLEVR